MVIIDNGRPDILEFVLPEPKNSSRIAGGNNPEAVRLSKRSWVDWWK
jgi:hypothetical protein